MKISNITSQIFQYSEKAKQLGEKFINGLVKEQLILRDYYKTFGKLNENEEEEEEVELEPEDMVIVEPEEDIEEPEEEIPTEDEPSAIVDPGDEDDIPNPDIPSDEDDIPIDDKIGTQKPEGDGYIRISPTQAKELLSFKGKIFQVVFTKKDGTLRAMNGMTGVRKYTSGGELPYSPKDAGVIPVYDLKIGQGSKGYRMINVDGLKTLHMNGKKFKIDQTLNEIKINKPINTNNLISQDKIKAYVVNALMEMIGEDITPGFLERLISNNDIISKFIKSEMMNDDVEVMRNNTPQIINNDTVVSEDELWEYIKNNKELKNDLLKVVLGYIKQIIDLNKITSYIRSEFNKKSINYDNEDKQDSDIIENDVYDIIYKYVYDNVYIEDLILEPGFKDYVHKTLTSPIYESTNNNQPMKKSELRQIIKEIALEVRGNQPSPFAPETKPTIDPDVKPAEPKRRRRTLTPPDDSPDTKPKAEGIERELSNKIASRFKKLK